MTAMHAGWPGTFASDSGPCYNSSKFKHAIEDMGIHHITKLSLLPIIEWAGRKICTVCSKPVYKGQKHVKTLMSP